MRSLFTTLLFALLYFTQGPKVMANNYVKVTGTTGTATYFDLVEHPTVSFTSDYLVLTTDRQTVQYPLSEFREFSFTDQTDGVQSTSAKVAPLFSLGSSLHAEGLLPSSVLSLYTLDGQLVGMAKVSSQGIADIPLQGRVGIFIVKSSSKTFKIILQ